VSRGKKSPAIFLDRDGVIIADKSYQIDPAGIEFLPGSVDALKRAGSFYLLIVVSNQSGIARGYFTSNDVLEFNRILDLQLKARGINISGWYFCPHGPDEGCSCRKPQTGLIFQAAAELSVDLDGSWVIGDKSSDIAAGAVSGLKTILIGSGNSNQEQDKKKTEPDFKANDLLEAMKIIDKDVKT